MTECEFRECLECAAKLGTPALCSACLHNRTLIGRLGADLKDVREQAHYLGMMIDGLYGLWRHALQKLKQPPGGR